ncbi:uncharacterized protein SAPINGB_P004812 [Magnusiomyces paraingens]|uniref:ML-like domain-containing protein n=1 Tax=Magnusiomyces paraingens TaxID=2606893 RepID=A0A5E8C2D0_9ASCO|nr:uncharacterized protein SAPINGB_P004812 [Saprochaete ingens]VVT56101.1 unnamed protein product [Saprochaete ingens]
MLNSLALGGLFKQQHPFETDSLSYSSQRSIKMPSKLMVLATIVTLMVWPATAARISFSNCIPLSAVESGVYFIPTTVDAIYKSIPDLNKGSLNFNIEGNMSTALEDLNPDTNKYATLRSQLNAVNYLLLNQYSRLCQNTAECPFGPGPSSFNYTFNVSEVYQGVPFNVRFVIINSVDQANVVGCIETQVTPIIASYAWYVVVFCIIGIAVLIAISFVITAYLNPWTGTTNIYSWASILHREVNVVRLLTPGFFDFIHYFQFAFFITCLSLEYPSFLQPVISTFSWVVLLFSESFVSHNGSGKFVDGIYATNGTFGLDRMSQVVQLAHAKDVWASFMVWLLVVTGAVLAIGQLAILATWAWRKYRSDTYDLRSRAPSFAFGLVLRIFFKVFHLPLLVFCFFQCVITRLNDGDKATSPAYLTVLATLVLVGWVLFAAFISYHLWKRAQRPTIFDNVSTLLKFGTLYNTYTEDSAMFFVIDFVTTFLRAMTIGAIQRSGLAQITLLAVIELAYFFSIIIVRPFDRHTSMNLISCIITGVRFTLIMLSLPFISSTGVSAFVRQWLGYVILIFHALALLLFLMRAIQVIIEVISRYTGAGIESTRSGAIYNLKQLSRRRRRPQVDMTELSTSPTNENKQGTPPHSDSQEFETGNNTGDQEDEEDSSGRRAGQGHGLDDDQQLHHTLSKNGHNGPAITRGGYTAVYPTAANSRGDTLYEDVMLSSPTSDISSVGGSIRGHNNNTNNPGNSPVGFTRSSSFGGANGQNKFHNDTVYYRRPRRRGSSHDWSSNPYVRDEENSPRQSTSQNRGVNEYEYDYDDEYDEEAEARGSRKAATSTDADQIRMGVVSPPPPGVDYAVREADIYYRQRREYNKRRRRHKKLSRKGAENDDDDGTPDEGDDEDMVYQHRNLREQDLLQNYEPYGGAAGELIGGLESPRSARRRAGNRGSFGTSEFEQSTLSTPGRLSFVQTNDDGFGDNSVPVGSSNKSGMSGSGILPSGRRNRSHLNSLVGLLESGNDEGGSGKSGNGGEEGTKKSPSKSINGVTGWLSRVKNNIGEKIREGMGKKVEDDDPLKPRGFEVLRRGPIKSYRSSSSLSGDSLSYEESDKDDSDGIGGSKTATTGTTTTSSSSQKVKPIDDDVDAIEPVKAKKSKSKRKKTSKKRKRDKTAQEQQESGVSVLASEMTGTNAESMTEGSTAASTTQDLRDDDDKESPFRDSVETSRTEEDEEEEGKSSTYGAVLTRSGDGRGIEGRPESGVSSLTQGDDYYDDGVAPPESTTLLLRDDEDKYEGPSERYEAGVRTTHDGYIEAGDFIFPRSTATVGIPRDEDDEYDRADETVILDGAGGTGSLSLQRPAGPQRNNSNVPTLRILTSTEVLQHVPSSTSGTVEGPVLIRRVTGDDETGGELQVPHVVANKRSKDDFNFL